MAERTPVAKALNETGFTFLAIDFSREAFELMQRKRMLAEEMHERFLLEGRLFLYDHLVAESIDPELFAVSRNGREIGSKVRETWEALGRGDPPSPMPRA